MSKRIEEFEKFHEGQTAYIICNGPGLRDLDWDLFKAVSKKGITIGMNGIVPNEWNFTPDYLVCVNPLAAKRFQRDLRNGPSTMFVSSSAEFEIWGEPQQQAGVIVLDTSLREMVFSTDLTKPIWEGYTVTFVALQLAYYMGCTHVVIVGMDHDFGVAGAQPNVELISDDPDQAHFKEDYFDKGTHWNAPDLANSEIAYALARHAFESDGRRIINASAHTKSKAFELVPFKRVAVDGPTLVSAIVSAYKAVDFMIGLMDDLVQQSLGRRLEIIVVAQKGTKEIDIARTYAICAPYETPLIKIIQTEDIPTVYEAWNIGIKAASGEFITNANTDDRHAKDAFETMAKVLQARPDIGLVYAHCFITWKPNTTYDEFVAKTSEVQGENLVAGRQLGEDGTFNWPPYELAMLRVGCFMGPQPMWRANLHQKYGYFDEGFISAGDYDFWLRIGNAGEQMISIPQLLGLYLAKPDGIELGDPETSQQETARAKLNNQHAAGVEYSGFTHELLELRLGREVAYIDAKAFLEVAGELSKKYEAVWREDREKQRKDKFEAHRKKKKKKTATKKKKKVK